MAKTVNLPSYTAPASLILAGEIGERYGKPLLACAVDYRVSCSIQGARRADARNGDVLNHIEKGVNDYLRGKSLPLQVSRYGIAVSGRKIPSPIDFRPAMAVAAAAALLELHTGKIPEPDVVNQIAHQALKKVNRTELGYRTSAPSFGGLIYARREFEFLKVVTRLTMKIPLSIGNKLYVLKTGGKNMDVHKKFGEIYNKNTQKAERALNFWEKYTRQMTVAIAAENKALFKNALEQSNNLYEELDLIPAYRIIYLENSRTAAGIFPLNPAVTGVEKS